MSALASGGTAILEVSGLRVAYSSRKRFLRAADEHVAVDDLSFTIRDGRTLGIVGESGSGKTSAAMAVMQLIRARSGSVRLQGRELTGLRGGELRSMRRHMQMVFQDPYGSFNPRATIAESLKEPMVVHGIGDDRSRQARILELLDAVGLPAGVVNRHPVGFSGGQLQRLSIARALTVSPQLIVADEPTSALDVSIQAQVVNLLQDLQREFNLTYLFISHDLPLVRLLADDIIVMYAGKVMEFGPSEEVLGNPIHPYTRRLLKSVPYPDVEAERRRRADLTAGAAPTGPVGAVDNNRYVSPDHWDLFPGDDAVERDVLIPNEESR